VAQRVAVDGADRAGTGTLGSAVDVAHHSLGSPNRGPSERSLGQVSWIDHTSDPADAVER
jgi:hypothetical protein